MPYSHLTSEQQAVVEHGEGHAQVHAVAGSGKTTTMVARVHYLIQQGISPQRILVVMFNKSAQLAFQERLQRWLPDQPIPNVRTFHSMGLSLVNSLVSRGFLSNNTLITQGWQKSNLQMEALAKVAPTVKQDTLKEWREPFDEFVSVVKSGLQRPSEVFKSLKISTQYDSFIEAYSVFDEMRQEKRWRLYDDLILDPVNLLLADPELAKKLQGQYDHILIDEYQDINEVQQALIRQIAGEQAQLMVVGDVDQCIYEWRGARPEFLLREFSQDFAPSTVYPLSYSFRYGPTLADLANRVISNNTERHPTESKAFHAEQKTNIHFVEEKRDALSPLVQLIQKSQKEGHELSDMAILVRLNSMSVSSELALIKAGIPYQQHTSKTVFDSPEIQAMMTCLYVADGRFWQGSPEWQTLHLQSFFQHPNLSLKRDIINHLVKQIVAEPDKATQWILACADSTHYYAKKRLKQRAVLWAMLQNFKGNAKDCIEAYIEETEVYDVIEDNALTKEQATDQTHRVEDFFDFVSIQNQSVGDFLDSVYQQQTQNSEEGVQILTIHKAKGLEWPVVIMPELKDELFPHQNADEESERRLFYVGVTRAQKELYLMHPTDPDLQNSQKPSKFTPKSKKRVASRFVYESLNV